MFRYTDDVLSLTNFVDRIYPIEHEKNTTDPDMSTSYLDLHLEIESEGLLRTKLHDNRDDFNIPIVNFRFKRDTFPAAAYGLYISQMIRYSRAYGPYQVVLDRGCC
jgi:arginine deiminase